MLKKHLFLLGVFVCVLVGGLVWYAHWHKRIPIEPLSITFGPKWVNQAQFAGEFAAIQKGFYAKYDLTVDIREFSFENTVLHDLKTGRSQLGLMSANEFLVNVAKGEKLQAIAAFYQVSPFAVVSLKSHKITSPTDLKNKRLAIKGGPGAEGESIYSILLKSAGVDTSQVKFKYLPFGTPEHEDLLEEKADTIGLYRTDQLYYFEKNNTAYNVLNPEQYGSAVYNDVLVATPEFLAQHAVAVKNFIRATQEGWKYAFAHREEALDITSQYVTQNAYKDREVERYILNKSEPLITPDPGVAIGSMDMVKWQEYQNTLRALQVLPQEVSLDAVVTTAYLP